MKLKKLPIGISTFREIIEDDYLYIDKTDIALNLINNGKYYFLSRPRRFGKSLFLDTLRTIFEGDKELFKGLYIYDKYDFQQYPVIRISFNDGNFKTTQEFEQTIYELLDFNQRNLGITYPQDFSSSGCFKRLIEEAYNKYNQKVVILVDEYDKPILDNIENREEARKRRDELKNFYSVIKGSDQYIKFVFITGVSKFSKVSLFSGLNNIEDITLDKRYSIICGYTQNDLETSFLPHLKGQDFKEIRRWYNGYKFLGEGVYNPFDILLFIAKGFEYRNYWFETGSPTYLFKVLEQNRYFLPNLENVIKDETMLGSFDVDNIELETLLWQTGYLTITNIIQLPNKIRYKLDIPNLEVQMSLFDNIANFLANIHNSNIITDSILFSLLENDFTKLEVNLKALYASIPYNHFTKTNMYKYEGYYVSVFYAYMKGLGFDLIGEDVTNKGRIDITMLLDNNIYIIEFKTDGKSALEQIRAKNYHEKYLGKNLPIFLVGIEFDTKDKNISKLEWEKVTVSR